jgi:hypothetical protein
VEEGMYWGFGHHISETLDICCVLGLELRLVTDTESHSTDAMTAAYLFYIL